MSNSIRRLSRAVVCLSLFWVSGWRAAGADLMIEPQVLPAGGAVEPVVKGSNIAADVAGASIERIPVAAFSASGQTQNLISVSLDDVPLQSVVSLFQKVSGANIIASATNLQGRVTVNLENVEWKPALDSILDMYNLMVVEKVPGSAIYSIIGKVPGASEPLIAQSIFLNYAQVSNVVSLVKSMIGTEGSVSAFPNANALIVRSTAATLSMVRKMIQEIDVPRQQVYIEAKFLELTDEAIKDLGINWSVLEGYGVAVGSMQQSITDSRNRFNGDRTGLGTVDSKLRDDAASGTGKGMAGVPGSGQTDIRSSSDTLLGDGTRTTSDSISKSANYSHEAERIAGQQFSDIRTAVLSADNFKLILSALQQINGISVVSNPKIIVANEETATIHIGNKEPNIKGTVTPGQQGQANTTTYTLDDKEPYFEYGISLDVTPTINNQSNVTVRIAPTLSRFVSNKTAPDNNTYPITSSKTIKTTFSLESGKTAAIGGLTETDDTDQVVKVPLLGDIPLIGKFLFSHTHKKHTQTETIIFVTVGLANSRTVTRDEGLPEETTLTQKHPASMKHVEKHDDGAKPLVSAKDKSVLTP